MFVIVLVTSVSCLGGSGVRLGLCLGLVCSWLLTNDRRLRRSGVLVGVTGILGLLLGRVFGLLSEVLRVLGGVLGLLGVVFRVLSRSSGDRSRRHGVGTEAASIGVDRLNVRSPGSELILGNIQDFSCSFSVRESGVDISRNNGSVVDKVEQLSCVLGQHDLLLGALDDSGGVKVVGLLELLAGDVGKLSFSDKRLSLCADKLLLKSDNLDRAGLLVLQLLDLVGNLDSRISMFASRVMDS